MRATSVHSDHGGVDKASRARFRRNPRPGSTSSASSSTATSTSSMMPRPRVHVDDAELCARAEAAAHAMDFNGLGASTKPSQGTWAPRKTRGDFTTYARRPASGYKAEQSSVSQQVLASGEIRCGLEEVVRVLHATSDFEHNAVMSGLYLKDFIYGSVVHVVPPEAHSTRSEDNALATRIEEERDPTEPQVAVKTGTFVHSKLFAPNEQWCFLERTQYSRTDTTGSATATNASSSGDEAAMNCFTLTLSSLQADELATGKASAHGRVDTLRDVSAGYLVEQEPGSRYVRVVFFGQFDGDESSSSYTPGHARPAAVRARLLRLAEGTARLPDMVRRRRFGAQTMADRTAFPARNTHCVCCTKSLRLLTRKHRCHLCGNFVCNRCWSVQEMQTPGEHRITSVRVCERCVGFVEEGDYSAVKSANLGHAEVRRDPAGILPASKTLAKLLREELRTTSGAKQESVRKVIQYLVNQEAEDAQVRAQAECRAQAQAEAQAKARADARAQARAEVKTQLLARAEAAAEATAQAQVAADAMVRAKIHATKTSGVHLTDASSEREYLDALDDHLRVPQVPLYQCVLANADKREYAIQLPKSAEPGQIPDAPIPLNEQMRVDAIAHSRVLELPGASELDTLCTLAAGELGCPFSIVTVVSADRMLVLGSNEPSLRLLDMPREHSFCQHAIMDNKPLVVPHPEADVRFMNIDARVKFGVRFYCGFPLVAEDGHTVIGSFCCLDQTSHELTQSQYSAMKKLSAAAARVVKVKTRELRAASVSSVGAGDSVGGEDS